MSALGVQPRRGRGRAVGRRRAGGAERCDDGDRAPRLFPDGGEPPAPGAAEPVVTSVDSPAPSEPSRRAAGSASGGRGDETTLEELVSGVWEELLGEGRATCPLCGGEMAGRASPHARPTEGRCEDCGTAIG